MFFNPIIVITTSSVILSPILSFFPYTADLFSFPFFPSPCSSPQTGAPRRLFHSSPLPSRIFCHPPPSLFFSPNADIRSLGRCPHPKYMTDISMTVPLSHGRSADGFNPFFPAPSAANGCRQTLSACILPHPPLAYPLQTTRRARQILERATSLFFYRFSAGFLISSPPCFMINF